MIPDWNPLALPQNTNIEKIPHFRWEEAKMESTNMSQGMQDDQSTKEQVLEANIFSSNSGGHREQIDHYSHWVIKFFC